MARRFVTYNTEDAEKLGIDQRGVMQPRWGYKEVKETMLIDNVSVTITENWSEENACRLSGVTVGETYTVTVDGVEYQCTAIDQSAYSGFENWITIGNAALADIEGYTGEDTGEPFVIEWCSDNDSTWFRHSTDGTYTVSVTGPVETIYPIPAEYSPRYDLVIAVDGNFSATTPLSALSVESGSANQACAALKAGRAPKVGIHSYWQYGTEVSHTWMDAIEFNDNFTKNSVTCIFHQAAGSSQYRWDIKITDTEVTSAYFCYFFIGEQKSLS